MIETIDRSCTPNADNLIKAAADYLREHPLGRHAALMREELVDLISSREKLSSHVAQNALRSGDIEVVRALKACGIDLNAIPLMRSMSVFSYSKIPTAKRTQLFNLVSKDIAPDVRSLHRVISEAFSVRDPALIDAALDWAPNQTFDSAMWSLGRFEGDAAAAPHFWRSMIDRVAIDSEATRTYASKWLTTRPSARSLAVMSVKGLRLAPIIAETSVVENRSLPWILRLRTRAASAHGEMDLKRTLPSIDELLVMPTGKIEAVLAGMSNNQKRKLRRAERKGKVPLFLQELKAVSEQ